VVETTGPAGRRGSRARSVLGGARGGGSGEVELFAWARRCGPWGLGGVVEVPEDLAHGDGVGQLGDQGWEAMALVLMATPTRKQLH
jgi:hypothetical protein